MINTFYGLDTLDSPAAFLVVLAGGREGSMRLDPLGLRQAWLPQGLRLGPVDDDDSEPFELSTPAAVEERIIRKARRLDEIDGGRG